MLSTEDPKLRTMEDSYSYMGDNPISEDSEQMPRYSRSSIDNCAI